MGQVHGEEAGKAGRKVRSWEATSWCHTAGSGQVKVGGRESSQLLVICNHPARKPEITNLTWWNILVISPQGRLRQEEHQVPRYSRLHSKTIITQREKERGGGESEVTC